MVIRKYIQRKYLILFLCVVALGLLVHSVFFSSDPQHQYITAKVERGNIERTVLADGTIKAYKQVSVGAQVSGQIKKLYVLLGHRVKKGDMIAEIDDLTQQNNVKQTEASLESLKAQRASKMALLNNDRLTYQRQQKLIQQQAGIQADLDLAKSTLESISADIEALNAEIVRAQIAVDTAKLDLGYTRIKAPIDGIVVAIPVEEGQTVNSVQSAPTIVKIAQLDKMTVEAKISEADVVLVKKGMPVYFSILGQPNHFYRGLTLRDIQPAPDSINNDNTQSSMVSGGNSTSAIYYNGLFDVKNTEGKLRISMTAQVYIVLGSAHNVITVPTQAIHQDASDLKHGIVYVQNRAGRIFPQKVTLGLSDMMQSEVVSGLSEGQDVIVGGLAEHDLLALRNLRGEASV